MNASEWQSRDFRVATRFPYTVSYHANTGRLHAKVYRSHREARTPIAEIGYVVDTEFFNEDDLNELERDLIYHFEQEVLRRGNNKPRKYSGTFNYSHILDMVRQVCSHNKKPSLEAYLIAIGHDVIEDDIRLKNLTNQWKQLYEQRKELHGLSLKDIWGYVSQNWRTPFQGFQRFRQEQQLKDDLYEQQQTLVDQIAAKRDEIKKELRDNFAEYLRHVDLADGRAQLMRRIDTSLDQITKLTRFSASLGYASSMQEVFELSGPQEDETLDQYLLRASVKLADRTINNHEHGPMIPWFALRRFGGVFSNSFQVGDDFPYRSIGGYFRDVFGNVEIYDRENPPGMKPAVKIGTTTKSIFALCYLNEALDTYFGEEADGYDPNLLDAVIKQKEALIRSSKALLKSAIEDYERENIASPANRVVMQREIESLEAEEWFTKITKGGPIDRWSHYIDDGDRYVERLDETWEQQKNNYRDAFYLSHLFSLFSEANTQTTRSGPRRFNLTRRSLNKHMRSVPHPWRRRAPRKRERIVKYLRKRA